MKNSTNPDGFSRADLTRAVNTLADTQRGQQALRDLLAFIANGGNGLDRCNQSAVMTVLACQFGPFAGSTRDEIKSALARLGAIAGEPAQQTKDTAKAQPIVERLARVRAFVTDSKWTDCEAERDEYLSALDDASQSLLTALQIIGRDVPNATKTPLALAHRVAAVRSFVEGFDGDESQDAGSVAAYLQTLNEAEQAVIGLHFAAMDLRVSADCIDTGKTICTRTMRKLADDYSKQANAKG